MKLTRVGIGDQGHGGSGLSLRHKGNGSCTSHYSLPFIFTKGSILE